jgi:hypothetical protein
VTGLLFNIAGLAMIVVAVTAFVRFPSWTFKYFIARRKGRKKRFKDASNPLFMALICFLGPFVFAAGFNVVPKTIVVSDKSHSNRDPWPWQVEGSGEGPLSVTRSTYDRLAIGDTLTCRVHELPLLHSDLGYCS